MTLALIGAGVMGQALVRSFCRQGVVPAGQIRIYDIDGGKAAAFAAECSAIACGTAPDAVRDADVVLLAVKPPVVAKVIESVASLLTDKMTIISIAAGVPVMKIRSLAGPLPAIARAMPNTPARIGEGMTAVCFDAADAASQSMVHALFKSCGLVIDVGEDLMDAVTGLSGSGPAYGMLIIEAMADAGVRLGIPKGSAVKMAAQTLLGASRLVLESGQTPAELRDQICTPGGTTVEGLYVLEEAGVRAALIRAVGAAADKSRKMRESAGSHA